METKVLFLKLTLGIIKSVQEATDRQGRVGVSGSNKRLRATSGLLPKVEKTLTFHSLLELGSSFQQFMFQTFRCQLFQCFLF